MKKIHLIALTSTVFLTACADMPLFEQRSSVAPQAAAAPAPRAPTRPPLTGAPRTVEEFDVVSDDEREAAVAAPVAAAGSIGTTVASLGDPGRSGFWLETPLVSEPTRGSILYRPTGRRLNVDLIPIAGPASGGSRISLSAMRMLDAPLTGLPQIDVFTN